MAARTIAFALGALFAHQLGTLPDPLWSGLAPLLLPALVAGGRLAAPAAFLVGVAWTAAVAHPALAARLPAALQGTDLEITGTVVGVPSADTRRLGFVLAMDDLIAGHADTAGWRWRGCRLRLSWYDPPPAQQVHAGERWSVTVRLRRVRGLRNDGGFDSEHRALRDGLCARGYLRGHPPPRRLAAAGSGLDALRERLAARLEQQVGDLPAAGIARALAVGLRDRVPAEQGWLMQRTGTAHLMAISGLHVGLVAGIGMLLGRLASRLVPGALERWPAAHWGALCGLGCAAAYAALAGFSVPTQRALFMLAVFLGASLARRRPQRWSALGLALGVVLVLDPLAVDDAGTWLSFAAVAGLLWALPPAGGRRGVAARLGLALRTQVAACVVLAPLAVLCFSYQSLVAPLANLIAIPVTGLLAVPLILAGVAADPLPWGIAPALLRAGTHVLGVLLEMLERLPGHDLVLVPAAAPSAAVLAGAFVGAALLLSPLAARVRVLGIAWLAPLAIPPPAAPAPGALRVQVLDVGQGLATVVRTTRHTLVFDAGPSWGGRLDAGAAVVAPALRRGGVGRVDRLLVSHHHSDHAGGVPGLVRVMTVTRISGDPGRLAVAVTPCVAGERWRWDGHLFRILHPGDSRGRGNDASCVVHVSGPGGSVLLPADVEAASEAELVSRAGNGLAADVLVVPHHGSRTSSTGAFLDAVAPSVAVNSSGHRNRFRMPAAAVVRRYRERGIRLLDTACDGQVRIDLVPGRAPRVRTWREAGTRFWHLRDAGEHCEH